jgi:hypothetical protein
MPPAQLPPIDATYSIKSATSRHNMSTSAAKWCCAASMCHTLPKRAHKYWAAAATRACVYASGTRGQGAAPPSAPAAPNLHPHLPSSWSMPVTGQSVTRQRGPITWPPRGSSGWWSARRPSGPAAGATEEHTQILGSSTSSSLWGAMRTSLAGQHACAKSSPTDPMRSLQRYIPLAPVGPQPSADHHPAASALAASTPPPSSLCTHMHPQPSPVTHHPSPVTHLGDGGEGGGLRCQLLHAVQHTAQDGRVLGEGGGGQQVAGGSRAQQRQQGAAGSSRRQHTSASRSSISGSNDSTTSTTHLESQSPTCLVPITQNPALDTTSASHKEPTQHKSTPPPTHTHPPTCREDSTASLLGGMRLSTGAIATLK